MDFQQAEAAVDGFVESEFPNQQVHGPDAARSGGARAIGDFIVDVRGGHDGLIATAVVVLIQATRDPPLALFHLFSYLGAHSKTSVPWVPGFCKTPIEPRKRPKVFEYFHAPMPANPSGFAGLMASPVQRWVRAVGPFLDFALEHLDRLGELFVLALGHVAGPRPDHVV